MVAQNLTDLTFNKLKVIRLDHVGGVNKSRKYWLCQCECGNTCVVRHDCLTRNVTKSCGCIPTGTPPKDLSGLKFGLLTAIKPHSKYKQGRAATNRWTWLCKCECGEETIVRTDSLLCGSTKSCGCLVEANNHKKWTGFEEISGTYWKNLIRGAKIRNKEFTLTIEEAWTLFIQQNRRCALSGEPLVFTTSHRFEKQTASLDRIDSSKGYDLGNVQWVHKNINNMKQSLSDNEFVTLCNKVIIQKQQKERQCLDLFSDYSI